MVVNAIEKVTGSEAQANRMRDAAAAQSKQKLLAAQRAADQQLEQSRQQAEAEVKQMMLRLSRALPGQLPACWKRPPRSVSR